MPNSGSRNRKAKAVNSTSHVGGGSTRPELSPLELEQIAQKYVRMIHATPDAITLRSLPDRRYVEVNEAFERLTGFQSAEVLGKTPLQLGIWVEGEARAETLKKLEREGQVYEEEFRFRTKSGEIRWGQLSAVRLVLNDEPFMLSITHDITNLKRAEEALRASEADFRSLMQEAPYGIYRVTKEGKLLHVNPALVRMLGYDSEAELLQRDFTTEVYRDPPARARLVQEYWRGTDFREIEMEWKRKDGQTIAVRLSGRPAARNEAAPYFEVFAEDITERRSLERQLLQSQKMDAIGRLAGGIAHDFNNLLGVILGHSEVLDERLGHDPRMHRSAEAIRSAAERAAALTMQLLAFSRKQVVQPKIIDVNAALMEMEKLMRRVVNENIEMVLKLTPGLGRVKIDPGQLDQVIMNLVVNARDAMPNGGKLILQTHDAELDDPYVNQHLGSIAGSYVMFSVSDTGSGMDEETISHIFEPFFTTKEKGRGTGLGLSTVYGIVKQANGYIMPYSEPAHGTTMKIYLPRAAQQAADLPADVTIEPIPSGAETVLLVEDESALRELTRSILEQAGYLVFEAAGADEAFQIVRKTPGNIDLLLTDVVMPGLGGKDLANRMKVDRPGLKVVYMSGYADDVVAHSGLLAEGTVLIEKPFTKRTLLTRVRKSLDQKS